MKFRLWFLMISLEPCHHFQLDGGVNIKFSHGRCPSSEEEVQVARADLAACVHRCAVRPWCAGLAFSRMFQLCYTFSTIFILQSNGPSSTGMCIYVKRESIKSEEAVACTQLCSHDPQAICDLGSSVCRAECPRFTLDNASVAGNVAEEGSTARVTCKAGFLVGNPIVTCQNGAWSEKPVCLESSCAALKQCNPGYGDGHYWMRLAALGDARVRVYCHNMTFTPAEFITVDPSTNYVVYGGASRESIPETNGRFKKVRIHLDIMQIQSIDRTFAEIDIVEHQFHVRYGRGRSCRTQNDTSGYFSIDTTGTGLVVDPELEWRLFGWYPSMINFSRSADGRRISAWCGGYCGVCRANGGIKLKFSPQDEIVGDAVEPVCV